MKNTQAINQSESIFFYDKNFSAHDMFLEQTSSGDAQNRKIGKPNNLKF